MYILHIQNLHIKVPTFFVASQIWCLIRLLPLIIGDLIPSDDPYWNNFQNLLTITDYVLVPKSTIEIAGYLQELICQHHTQFKQLYPDRPIMPKFHHMIHLPQWIIQYVYLYWQTLTHKKSVCRHGPMIQSWCMRYEAKHHYFKRWATIMRNYKNIPKTLALHYQRYICYQLAGNSNNAFLVNQLLFGQVMTL